MLPARPCADVPGGRGPHRLRSPEGALAGIEKLNSRYEFRCKAARELAEEYFDAATVLPRLIVPMVLELVSPRRAVDVACGTAGAAHRNSSRLPAAEDGHRGWRQGSMKVWSDALSSAPPKLSRSSRTGSCPESPPRSWDHSVRPL